MGICKKLVGKVTAYVLVLDAIGVHVLRAGAKFADVLLDGQIANEDLGLVVTSRLIETEIGGSALVGKGQLAKGCVRLLTVQLVG